MKLFLEKYQELLESLQWPVSVRTDKFKKQFDGLKLNARFVKTYMDLITRILDNPEPVRELSAYSSEHVGKTVSAFGTFYKLEINPPGQHQYRAIAFEPSECPGLIIWFWIGTHEDYNKEWRNQIRKVPSDWVAQAPYLVHACRNAKAAKGLKLPAPQSSIEAVKRREASKIAAAKRQELKRKYSR